MHIIIFLGIIIINMEEIFEYAFTLYNLVKKL
jgi:hypothetical protein